MSLLSILTILAIIIGPCLAVWGNGYLDRRREQRARKMDIFRTLMRTRDARLSPDHIAALNLVEIEFVDHPEVIKRWRELHQHFGTIHAKHPKEATEPRLHDERIGKERLELLTQMLDLMAKVLKFRIEQMEILRGGYYPQGHADIESEQSIIRHYIVDLASGQKIVPVAIINLPNTSDNPDPSKSS